LAASLSRVVESKGAPIASGRLPGLDGIRALAVARVIAHHFFDNGPIPLASYHFRAPLVAFVTNSSFGADMFFVLSGFLITWLLLKEERRTGGLNLTRFYTQRALRILPPAIFLVAVLALMNWAGLIEITRWEFLSSMTFVRNYALHGVGSATDHFWSLAIEEQFYILWPLTLVLIPSPRWRMAIICTLLVGLPFWRQANYVMAGGAQFVNVRRSDLHCDPLLMGCALAMIRSTPLSIERLRSRVLQSPLVPLICTIAIAAVLCGVLNLAPLRHLGFLKLTIVSVALALVLNYVVEHGDDVLGRILNHPILVGLGTISYSLYLWQQLAFLKAPGGSLPWTPFPVALIVVIAMTMVSYFWVEKPFNTLRARIKSESNVSDMISKLISRNSGAEVHS
jgi:peptidoglycan/LPS O-acetylase OafA/YrhL